MHRLVGKVKDRLLDIVGHEMENVRLLDIATGKVRVHIRIQVHSRRDKVRDQTMLRQMAMTYLAKCTIKIRTPGRNQ